MSKNRTIKRILMANRGEIACRVIRSCREMGIEVVTLFTPVEADYPHRLLADFSVNLGDGNLAETYLNQEKIIAIAKKYNVDAIHPGYGFLSENAAFARLVAKNELILIGPTAENMTLMGDKKASKQLMEEIGVPLIPGYHGDKQDHEFLFQEAKKIGLPLLIKASAGGGGKGMRVVNDWEQFETELAAAKREAMNAFGDDIVLLERYITSPRHIEIQVISDQLGNHYHLFERECSIQRRHQKMVEESPSSVLTPELREKMAQDAVTIASHINYVGAGTIEYILDLDGSYYFLEMNTRLQVEHPVTEFVTGLDLVKLQIQVAQGQALPFKQEDLRQAGHAIEVRLYAEDPDNNFLPSIGVIESIGQTNGDCRLDIGLVNGNEVSVNFDPMLAKLISYGVDREDARLKLIEALKDYPFIGVKTNREYLLRILKHPEFIKGNTLTHFVSTYEGDLGHVPLTNEEKMIACALGVLSSSADSSGPETKQKVDQTPWAHLHGFRN